MSTAERLFKSGIEQGIERGIERGIEQGVGRGEAGMLQKALAFKFGAVPAELAARVEAASAAERERWMHRVFEARSLAEVFAD